MPKAGMVKTIHVITVVTFTVLLTLLATGCTTTVTPSGIRLYCFFDPTCPCCAKTRSGFESVGDRFDNKLDITTYDVTEPHGARLADKYKLDRMPAFIIVDRDGRVVDRLSGGGAVSRLERFISKNISKCR